MAEMKKQFKDMTVDISTGFTGIHIEVTCRGFHQKAGVDEFLELVYPAVDSAAKVLETQP